MHFQNSNRYIRVYCSSAWDGQCIGTEPGFGGAGLGNASYWLIWNESRMKIIIRGNYRVGKTTMVQELLKEIGPGAGFYTENVSGRRQDFVI